MTEKVDLILRELAELRADVAKVLARVRPEASGRERIKAIVSTFPATPRPERERDAHTLYCSYCGKSQHDVAQLIAGPGVHICDECTLLCAKIVENRRQERTARVDQEAAKPEPESQ